MQQQHEFVEEDIRLVDVLESINSYLKFLLKKWYISILGVAFFTFGGYYIAKTTPPNYVANISFNALDARAGAMGGIMSMIGVSFAGGSSNDVLTGIFTSRNIFFNSLLSEVEIDNKSDKLANFYMTALKYNEGFEKDPVLKNFKFKANSIAELSKQELDMLGVMYADFKDGLMTAEYDIATGVIKAEIETPNYDVTRQLGMQLLNNTIKFYQQKQLQNAESSFNNSSRRLDSLSNEIKLRQRLIASSQDQNIFNRKKLSIVEQQKLSQEIAILTTLYSDATSSKETAKAGLKPQENMVRVIDDPSFSTAPDYRSKFLFAIIGFAISLIVVIIPLLLRKAILDGREEDRIKAQKQAAAITTTA